MHHWNQRLVEIMGTALTCADYGHCPHLIGCTEILLPDIVSRFWSNKTISWSQEPQNHIHDTTTRITTDMPCVFEATVQRWQCCFEIGGERIELHQI
jgi:hypothetical protein